MDDRWKSFGFLPTKQANAEVPSCSSDKGKGYKSTNGSATGKAWPKKQNPPSSTTNEPTSASAPPSPQSTPTVPSKRRKLAPQNRVFLKHWKVGRPWLEYDTTNEHMVCSYCKSHKTKIKPKMKKTTFIDGCTSMKIESIVSHEKSHAHVLAEKIESRGRDSNDEPPTLIKMMNEKEKSRLIIKFRNAHAIAKHNRSFRDYHWLTDLDEAKGLDVGLTYRTPQYCTVFVDYIARAEIGCLTQFLEQCSFIAVTVDGATDASTLEQESVIIRCCKKGTVYVFFVGLGNPQSQDASGIYESIIQVLQDVNITEEDLKKALVGFGSDGASVMLGHKGGVARKFKELQPSLLIVHCFVHRLELAYKDAVKGSRLYDSVVTLLMGIFYFYKKSSKNRKNLMSAFKAFEMKVTLPTRVGGTRWVSHFLNAAKNFQKGRQAITSHLEDVITQSKGQTEAKGKASGYLRLCKRNDVTGFLCVLLDLFQVLSGLSLSLQDRNIVLCDVSLKVKAVMEQLDDIKNGKEVGDHLKEFLAENNDAKSQKSKQHLIELSRKLQAAIHSRYADLYDDPVVKATSVANLKSWPTDKDLVQDFGNEEIITLKTHFEAVLRKDDDDDDDGKELLSEWRGLKRDMYARYEDKVPQQTWTRIFNLYDTPRIQRIIDLVLTLPSTSVENERIFSKLKLVKTDRRTRLNNRTLNNLLLVSCQSKDIKNYDPQPAMKLWWEGATRHTNYKEGRMMRSKKSTKVQQKDEVGTVKEVEAEAKDVEENKVELAVENVAAEIVPSNDTDDDESDDDEGFDELSLSDDDEYELSEKQVNDNMKNIITIMDNDDDL